MSKFKIINLFDKIFITTSVFLLVYAWINFFIRDLWVTFFLSLIFSSACVFILFYLLNIRKEKKAINKEYLNDIEEKFLAFQLLDKNEKLNLIKSTLKSSCKCEKIKDSLLCSEENQIYQIMIETDCEKLSQFHLIKLTSQRAKNIERLVIICCGVEQNLNRKFLKNLEIVLVDKKQLYDIYFLPNKLFPDTSNLNTKTDRKKITEIAKNFFVPHKAKSYFLCGLILIFSSIILPFHFYYLIFGSTLLIFSIICRLQPCFNH